MDDQFIVLRSRIERLENALQRRSRISAIAVVAALSMIAVNLSANSARIEPSVGGIVDEVRTRRLIVVDDQDRMRVEIAQDSPDVDRYARSAGLTIYDDRGHERGGIATIDDGSAVVALDSPWGVGSPMRDRAGMKVSPDGSAVVGVISNRGAYAAVLQSDGVEGRLELYRPDDEDGVFEVRTIHQGGEAKSTSPMSEEQKAPAQ